ncbi:MAG TPA: GNAT family N-acetyltransferase [Mycobacteriales bacterium]|nr:GNAT family N-acetyltransferase [Mycobacteriales bacterium]
MEWHIEADLPAFGHRVMPWLERDPVRNTVQATVLRARLEGLVDPEPPWLAWLGDGGEVAGVAVQTPPRGILLSPLPSGAARALAAVVPPALPGAAGPPAEVEAFTTAYAERIGARPTVAVRQRLFRLDRVVPHPPVPGRLREAKEADVERVLRWLVAFAVEAHTPAGADAGIARRAVDQRRALLWEVGGEPVSLVGHTAAVAGVPRVGPVYTPPEHRRRGYAGAATAATCARLLERGARTVVLFADRANPTATGVYRRIGFDPVGDHDDWALEY